MGYEGLERGVEREKGYDVGKRSKREHWRMGRNERTTKILKARD